MRYYMVRLELEDRLLEGAALEERIKLRASDPVCRAWNRALALNLAVKPVFYPNCCTVAI